MADSDKLGPPFDTSQPGGLSDPRDGDNKIRDVKQRLYNWATREHNVDGKHKLYTNSAQPAITGDTPVGHPWIDTDTSELYAYMSGGLYTKLTSKSEVTTLQGGVAALETNVAALVVTDGSLQTQINNLSAEIDALPPISLTAQTPVVYTIGGTFNDPTATFILVECWGGGGPGGNSNPDTMGGCGGGGGGYAASLIFAVGIGSVNFVVGAAKTPGNNGESSYFGSFLTAGGGGKGGEGNGGAIGAGGVNGPGADASSPRVLSFQNISGGNGGYRGYKCGGAGGGCAGTAGANATSEFGAFATGGTGGYGGGGGGVGATNTNGPAGAGIVPGGGGGGAPQSGSGGNGARGQIRITVYR